MPLCGSHFERAENGVCAHTKLTREWPLQGRQQASQVLGWKLAVGLCKLISEQLLED